MTQNNNQTPRTTAEDPFFNIDRILRNETVQKPAYSAPQRQNSDPFEGLRPSIPATQSQQQQPSPTPTMNWGDLESEIASFTTAQKRTTAEYHAMPDRVQQQNYTQYQEDRYNKSDYQQEPSPSSYAPERKQRGGVKTMAGILGVFLIGALGVFGYRAATGGSAPSTPTAIKAPTTPEKIVVQNQKEPIKSVMERAPNGQERVVPRDEKPLNASQQAEQSTTQKVINSAIDPDEPKKVRTITISGAANGLQGSGSTAPSVPSIFPSTNSPDIMNVPTKAVRTQNIAPPPEKPAATPPAAIPPAKMATASIPPKTTVTPPMTAQKVEPVAPTKPVATRPVSGGPMAIGPGTVQLASAAPIAATPAKATPSSGNFVVQVGSAASEKEARDKYKTLQTKNSALSGKSLNVIEAEKPDGSTFYRMRLAPTSKESANALCNQLIASAGKGACFVVAN